MNIKGKKKKNQVVTANIFEQQEMIAKAEEIKRNLKASTWHELETKGKFDKNKKLTFISDDMLILGCDAGSETHYVRAIDTRGRELSKSAFPFSNTKCKRLGSGNSSSKRQESDCTWLRADRPLLVLPCHMDDC